MKQYHKIYNVFERDEKTHKLIEGQYKLPEFECLASCEWMFTEKVDGTNIRIIYDNEAIEVRGKTDNAQIPPRLLEAINSLFHLGTIKKITEMFGETQVTFYGEGYGAKIQKGGGLYRSDNGFAMFDIRIGDIWLKWGDVVDIAEKLEIETVSIVGRGTLIEAVEFVKSKPKSTWGDFVMEGVVAKPTAEVLDRMGRRIITKIKVRDF